FQTNIQNFLSTLLVSEPRVRSNYQDIFWHAYQERINRRKIFVETAPYSDFGVYYHIFNQLPKECNLHLSNSATIRYAQLFSIPKSVSVYCNRGTSGIDGSTSTAIGAAVASNKQTLLVTGDLSFFYDSNALWNANTPNDFRIIVVNNSGGG